MAARNFLAFDLGAESGRALLGSISGGKLTLEEKHRFPNPNGRLNGRFQWDLLAQWEELKTGMRRAGDRSPSAGAVPEIHGIGVDTWGVDFGLIGPDGEVLGNPSHYRDRLTDGIMERTFGRVSKEKIYEVTGLQFMQFNSLFQLLAMREAKSRALEAAETMLFMPDLFNYLFTGCRMAEFSIASTSQMIDPRTGNWATGLLEELGLPTKLLPKIVPSGTVLGALREDVAVECGIAADRGVPVIAPACHDTASAVAAVPAAPAPAGTDADWCYISSGTWSLMGVELDKPIINDKSLSYSYTNEGGVGGKIRFLKNIMGLWLVQECRRHWVKEGSEHSYAELTRMAADSRPFGAFIDPEHKPFAVPGAMPDKICRFCSNTGQVLPQTRGEYIRACLESLALTYRRTIDGLEDVLGRKIAIIHIVGGGTQNELLNQMTADACARPVVAGPVEATAIGNILVQAMATGAVKSLEEARAIVRASFDVKRYEPMDTRRWEDAYGRYMGVVGR